MRPDIVPTTTDDPKVVDLLALAVGDDPQRVGAAVDLYRLTSVRQLGVASANGEYVGIVGYAIDRSAITLLHIATAVQRRHEGIGTALLAWVLKRTPADRPVIAETDSDSVGFYRDNGFAITSLGEKYVGTERFSVRYDRFPVD